jgi:maltose O-acetyltransferase
MVDPDSAGREVRDDIRPDGAPSLLARVSGALRGEVDVLHPRLRVLEMLVGLLPHFCFNRLRTRLYRSFGLTVGPRTMILGPIELSGGGDIWKKLRIGADCQITSPLYVDLNGEVTIGDRVALAHHVILVTSSHELGTEVQRCGPLKIAPIVIEDGCWIGAGAMVLPGVTIGRGSVIAAGAIVSSDIPPNTLAGGVPARPIKSLPTAANTPPPDQ